MDHEIITKYLVQKKNTQKHVLNFFYLLYISKDRPPVFMVIHVWHTLQCMLADRSNMRDICAAASSEHL